VTRAAVDREATVESLDAVAEPRETGACAGRCAAHAVVPDVDSKDAVAAVHGHGDG
jgi:hypothetical protein